MDPSACLHFWRQQCASKVMKCAVHAHAGAKAQGHFAYRDLCKVSSLMMSRQSYSSFGSLLLLTAARRGPTSKNTSIDAARRGKAPETVAQAPGLRLVWHGLV